MGNAGFWPQEFSPGSARGKDVETADPVGSAHPLHPSLQLAHGKGGAEAQHHYLVTLSDWE